MPSAANEVVIARPPDEVFAFPAERENDLQWRTGVLDMKRVSGNGVGARYAQGVKGPGGRRIDADIEITEVEPGRTPDDAGTRVRFELEAEVSGLKKLMAPMVQKTMNAEVGQLERLKQLLENEHHASGAEP